MIDPKHKCLLMAACVKDVVFSRYNPIGGAAASVISITYPSSMFGNNNNKNGCLRQGCGSCVNFAQRYHWWSGCKREHYHLTELNVPDGLGDVSCQAASRAFRCLHGVDGCWLIRFLYFNTVQSCRLAKPLDKPSLTVINPW